MDEELAEHLEALDDGSSDKRAPELRVLEATPEVMLLMRIVALTQAQLQSKQAKRIPFPPLPKVKTARDALKQRLRGKHRQRLQDLVSRAQARFAAQQERGRAETAVEHDAQQVWTE